MLLRRALRCTAIPIPRATENNKSARRGLKPWVWAKLAPASMARRGRPRRFSWASSAPKARAVLSLRIRCVWGGEGQAPGSKCERQLALACFDRRAKSRFKNGPKSHLTTGCVLEVSSRRGPHQVQEWGREDDPQVRRRGSPEDVAGFAELGFGRGPVEPALSLKWRSRTSRPRAGPVTSLAQIRALRGRIRQQIFGRPSPPESGAVCPTPLSAPPSVDKGPGAGPLATRQPTSPSVQDAPRRGASGGSSTLGCMSWGTGLPTKGPPRTPATGEAKRHTAARRDAGIIAGAHVATPGAHGGSSAGTAAPPTLCSLRAHGRSERRPSRASERREKVHAAQARSRRALRTATRVRPRQVARRQGKRVQSHESARKSFSRGGHAETTSRATATTNRLACSPRSRQSYRPALRKSACASLRPGLPASAPCTPRNSAAHGVAIPHIVACGRRKYAFSAWRREAKLALTLLCLLGCKCPMFSVCRTPSARSATNCVRLG